MPAPTNITRNAATSLGTLPASVTQDVEFAGVTYDVWYKVTAAADGVIGLWGFGAAAGPYEPLVDVYENADVSVYLNPPTTPENVPYYFPVTAGNEYFFNVYMIGSPFVTPAILTLTASYAQSNLLTAGDFLTNLEEDTDAEYPASILAGDTDHTVRRYEQLSAPISPRGTTGLPHGEGGAVFTNGNVAWLDNQYPNLKVYDTSFAEVATFTFTADGWGRRVGVSRSLQRMYIAWKTAPAAFTVEALDATGTSVDTWMTTITSIKGMAVNSDESILYYSQGGTSTILRWDLTNNVAMANLVADTAGYEIQDLLYLEDDTILTVLHQEATTPRDVNVLRYDTAGALQNTYAFGDFWRSELNPPRLGFALDSPDSFWIVLKPQANFQISEFHNIETASGADLDQIDQTNFLEGVYIGSATATPESLYGSEKSYALLVAPVSIIPESSQLNGPAALAAFEADGTMRDYRIVWSRRAPHLADEGQRINYYNFQLDMETGVGTVDGQGVLPTCELRWSNDGGGTWSAWAQLSMGALGKRLVRARKPGSLGQSRDRVFEVRGSDPVFVALLQAYIDPVSGTN